MNHLGTESTWSQSTFLLYQYASHLCISLKCRWTSWFCRPDATFFFWNPEQWAVVMRRHIFKTPTHRDVCYCGDNHRLDPSSVCCWEMAHCALHQRCALTYAVQYPHYLLTSEDSWNSSTKKWKVSRRVFLLLNNWNPIIGHSLV